MKQRRTASTVSGRHETQRRAQGGVLAVLTLLGSGTAVATDHDYVYSGQFGSYGSGNGQFIGPTYNLNFVAFDPSNHNILVADSGNYRVQILTSNGTYLRQFGSQGSGNGQFNGIGGIAVDPGSHNIVVGDENGRVQVFNSAGVYLSKFGTPGGGNGQFNGPGEIAIDPVSRNIVVSDNGNDRIQIFSANGSYLGKFGSPGGGNGQFRYPLYLTIDPGTRNLLVADEINGNVQIFSPNGSYLRQFGSRGSGNGQFGSPGPGAVSVDAVNHNIAVEDYANSRVQVFDANGTYLSQFGSAGNGNGQFNATNGPTGMDIDQSSHGLVVLDRGNSRAELFAPSSVPPPPPCGPTQVSLSIEPLTATLSQAILFSAQASIRAPFAGIVSFMVDGTTAACTAAMVDVYATCTHPLQLGTHSVVAQYSGDGQNQPGCSAPQSVTVIPDGGQLPTNITCTFAPNPAVQGQPVVTTCSVGAGTDAYSRTDATRPDTTSAPEGYVTFSQGANVLAYEPLFDGTAVYATVLGGGSYSLSADYSGDGGNATSTDQIPIVVQAPADDIFYGGFEIPPG